MNHQEAVREMAVERYLLGELIGASLDSFEEHLFECSECAMDVKTGVTFIDAARTELSVPRRVSAPSWRAHESGLPGSQARGYWLRHWLRACLFWPFRPLSFNRG